MKRAVAAACLVMALAVPVRADPPTAEQLKRIDEICAHTACRTGGFDVAVFIDATHLKDVPVSRAPYVTPEGEVLIFPGETVAVQFDVTGDTLSSPRFLKQYATPKDVALKIQADSTLTDDPLNASLPPIPEKDGAPDMTAFPPGTLLISYGQFSDHDGMVMTLETNLPGRLKLDATMSLIKTGAWDWRHTSTCPLMSGVSSLENWPGALGPMRLSHFRVLAKDAKLACE